MLNPSSSAENLSPAAPLGVAWEVEASAVEEPVAPNKPKRKRAPRIKREGVAKGMRVRLLPTPEQAADLRRWAGSSRWVWNWALGKQTEHYRNTGKHLSSDSLSRELTQVLKSDPSLDWLGQVPRTCLTRALKDLGQAWTNFFDGVSGKRADAPGRPKFKYRGGSREGVSFQVDPRHKSPVDMDGGRLRLAVVGLVEAVYSEPVVGHVASISVKQRGEHWYASLTLVDVPVDSMIRKPWKARVFEDPLDPTGLVAMDASVVHGGVATNDGATTWSMKELADRARADEKLARKKRYQRRQARKQDHRLREAGLDPKKPIPKGTKLIKSRRQEKLDKKVAGIDLHMLFSRQDAIHKFTTDLVRNHHTIVVETLMLSAMAKSLNRGFRRRMHEACMGEIIRQLKYKSKLYSRTLLFVDRWFPSSKRCSNPACHQKNSLLKLKDRAWVCPHCSTFHERDDNAAFNLWQEGWRLLREQQASTSCSVSTVGSTGVVRRGTDSGTAVSGAGLGSVPVKRKSSRKILALPNPEAGKEPDYGLVG